MSREIVFAIGVAQGLFLIFMLTRDKKRNVHALVLSAWISLFVLNLALESLVTAGILKNNGLIHGVASFFPFLFSPFLYYSCKTAMDRSFAPSWSIVAHATPFLVAAALRIYAGVSPLTGLPAIPVLLNALNIPLFVGVVAYHAACLGLARRYSLAAREYLSAPERSYVSWITTLIVLSASVWVIALIMIALNIFHPLALNILYTIVVYVISYRMVATPNIFTRERILRERLSDSGSDSPRYGTPEEISRKLRAYVARTKAFLKPEITIADICDGLGIPLYVVSKTLNGHLGLSFYQFINEFRVAEAQRLLSSDDSVSMTVLEAGLASGFNSKSAFNDVFRRSTGMTPSEFKKKGRNSTASE